MTSILPVETLRQLLRLDPETGRLFWRERGVEWFMDGPRIAAPEHARKSWNARWAGKEACTTDNGDGYRRVKIAGRFYRAHRVVFALLHGRWPDEQVDHINGVRSDNRPSNLREATNAQNCRNRGVVRGSSRFCGVDWHKRDKRWRAKCADAEGRVRSLGHFTDEAAAARAYDCAAKEWHGEFARLNFPQDATC